MKDNDVVGQILYDTGQTLYRVSLRMLRWMRIPVLLFGIGAMAFGLWIIFYSDALGVITFLSGALIVFMNLSTWKLVYKFTKHQD